MESGQFLKCFLFGRITHPSQILNAFSQRCLQILHQSYHTFFGSSREIFFHVHLPYGFSQRTVNRAHSTFPTRLHLLFSGHDFTIKFKVLRHKIITQATCCVINKIPLQISFLIFKRYIIYDIVHLLYGIRLTYIYFRQIIQTESRKEHIPCKRSIFLLHLFHCFLIIVGMRITQFHHRTGRCSQTGFNLHNSLHCFSGNRLVISGKPEHLHNMVFISLTNFFCLIIIFQIIIALTHSQTGLISMHRVHRTVHIISSYINSKIRMHSVLMHFCYHGINFGLIFQSGNLL